MQEDQVSVKKDHWIVVKHQNHIQDTEETSLNILKCQTKVRRYKRFVMKHPNEMVQMDILGPFYLSSSSQRNYIITCLDDCSRKVASRWSERKRSVDVLNVLEDWIMTNGKPKTVI